MHESVATALRDWQSFYILTGGAAATLAGLLFLAVQFGASVRYPAGVASALETFVSPTFIRFVDVLIIAVLALMPSMTRQVLGVVFLLLAIVNAWSLYVVLRRSFRDYEPSELKPTHWVWNVSAPALAYILMVVAGIALLLNLSWALTGMGVVVGTLLVTALLNTWQMMTWISEAHMTAQEETATSDMALPPEPVGRRSTERLP